MAGQLQIEFSDNDIRFLVETVDTRLLDKVEVVKRDRSIIEALLEQEAGRLFERIMLADKGDLAAGISSRLLFEVLLRKALQDLQRQKYTVERTGSQRIPIFDSADVVDFFSDRTLLSYLADMLVSFTHVDSFTTAIKVRKGIYRKVRFSDMDIDSLTRLSRTVDEEHRFKFYKRIGDLCLFILGMFPEYATQEPGPIDALALFQSVRKPERSAGDYEEEGRLFYRLAGEHKDAAVLELSGVFHAFYEKFDLARKPLNYISGNLIQSRKHNLFPEFRQN